MAWLIFVLAVVLGCIKAIEELDLLYSNNFFIILSSSKFYFNYRHSSDPLGVYQHLKKHGITDDRILLMLPENHACNARNPQPGTVSLKLESEENFYCDDVEVDYKSDDLTYEAILNLFRGRYEPDFPESKKLRTDENSIIFVYFTGHGGENFFKIQDTEVLSSEDLAKVYEEMNIKRKYK
jgi:phosphatidylinositol glycan class K